MSYQEIILAHLKIPAEIRRDISYKGAACYFCFTPTNNLIKNESITSNEFVFNLTEYIYK